MPNELNVVVEELGGESVLGNRPRTAADFQNGGKSHYLPELAAVEAIFVQNGQAAIVIFPSAPAPTESNRLINPLHPDLSKVRVYRSSHSTRIHAS